MECESSEGEVSPLCASFVIAEDRKERVHRACESVHRDEGFPSAQNCTLQAFHILIGARSWQREERFDEESASRRLMAKIQESDDVDY